MGFNLSNQQMAQELALNKDAVQKIMLQLREGVVEKKTVVMLQDKVECAEVHIVAGHKGNPVMVNLQTF